MREIKFRGKRVDNGEWVYGSLVHNQDTDKYFIDYSISEDYNSEKEFDDYNYGLKIFATEIISETMGQYTGLKDKNGVEIYEGDIVEYIYEPSRNEEFGYFKANEKGIISFKSTGFYYETVAGTNKYASHFGWLTSIPHDGGKLFKVIGTIFDKED